MKGICWSDPSELDQMNQCLDLIPHGRYLPRQLVLVTILPSETRMSICYTTLTWSDLEIRRQGRSHTASKYARACRLEISKQRASVDSEAKLKTPHRPNTIVDGSDEDLEPFWVASLLCFTSGGLVLAGDISSLSCTT